MPSAKHTFDGLFKVQITFDVLRWTTSSLHDLTPIIQNELPTPRERDEPLDVELLQPAEELPEEPYVSREGAYRRLRRRVGRWGAGAERGDEVGAQFNDGAELGGRVLEELEDLRGLIISVVS